MALIAYSETNLANSVATTLSGLLLASGYLVYWHDIDAVQTPDGWYFEYSTKAPIYLADVTFGPRIAASRGLMTLTQSVAAYRRYSARPTSDGTVSGQDDLPVPMIVIEVGPLDSAELFEMGATLRFRTRPVLLYGTMRSPDELRWVLARMETWLSEGVYVEVRDHDSGSLAVVGDVEVVGVSTERAEVPLGPDTLRYEFLHEARVEFVA